MKKGEELSQSLPLRVGVGVLMILVQITPSSPRPPAPRSQEKGDRAICGTPNRLEKMQQSEKA